MRIKCCNEILEPIEIYKKWKEECRAIFSFIHLKWLLNIPQKIFWNRFKGKILNANIQTAIKHDDLILFIILYAAGLITLNDLWHTKWNKRFRASFDCFGFIFEEFFFIKFLNIYALKCKPGVLFKSKKWYYKYF